MLKLLRYWDHWHGIFAESNLLHKKAPAQLRWRFFEPTFGSRQKSPYNNSDAAIGYRGAEKLGIGVRFDTRTVVVRQCSGCGMGLYWWLDLQYLPRCRASSRAGRFVLCSCNDCPRHQRLPCLLRASKPQKVGAFRAVDGAPDAASRPTSHSPPC